MVRRLPLPDIRLALHQHPKCDVHHVRNKYTDTTDVDRPGRLLSKISDKKIVQVSKITIPAIHASALPQLPYSSVQQPASWTILFVPLPAVGSIKANTKFRGITEGCYPTRRLQLDGGQRRPSPVNLLPCGYLLNVHLLSVGLQHISHQPIHPNGHLVDTTPSELFVLCFNFENLHQSL